MGAIQGSINSMLGTTAIAAAAGKHAMEQKSANEMQKAQLNEQAITKSEEIKELQGEAETILSDNPELTAVDIDKRLEIEEAEGGSDLAKAKEAMDVIGKKIAAKEAQKKMLEQSFANVGKSPIEILFGGRK
jgi:hypothetical protein